MIPESFKTIPSRSTPINGTMSVSFAEVTSSIGPRIRVHVTAPANEGWFIQMNPVDPNDPGEWFTVPSSARQEGLVYYDASPKPTSSPRWWRAIRKS
jgi:glycine cleavage system H lipoate-binding protein